jgi:EmrB/QacA subfamily drug resistance transporter
MTTQEAAAHTAAGGGSPIPEGRRWLSLAMLAGALGLDVSGLGVLNAALPRIGEHFHLANTTLQWVMTSYAVAFAGFLLFGGRAADVLGRRMIFVCGIALFSLAALGGSLAPNVDVLIVARALQGVGAALSGPAALALLTEVFPEGPERNRAFAVYGAVGAASFSGGVLLGGVLTQFLTWRSVLVFSVLLGIAVLSGARASLPRSVRHPHKLDLPGAVLVTAGLLLVVFGFSRASSAGWTDSGVLTSLILAAALLTSFILWERHTAEPLLPLSIFRGVPVRAGALTAVLYYTAALGLLFFAPLYMQDMLGYSPFLSGLAVVPASASVFVAANFFAGKLLAKIGPQALLIIGLVFIGVGIGLWVWTPLDGNYWANLLPGLVLNGIGQGLAFPAMTISSLTGVDQRQHGVAGAVNVTAQQIGSSIGVAVLVVVATASATGGTTAGRLAGYHAAYLTAAIACFFGALVIAVLRKGWSGSPAAAAPVEGAEQPA